MAKWFYFALFGTFVGTFALAQNSETMTQKKPTILLVGMKHLDDSTKDIASPKRQKEVQEIVELLKRYQPTKIGCERPYGDEETFELYRQYLKGDYQLSKHESNQIGFRLAKELHHKTVYPIDYRHHYGLSSPDFFARANNQEVFVQRWQKFDDSLGQQLEHILKTSSLLELLRWINADSLVGTVDRALLSSNVHIGKDANYVGTDDLSACTIEISKYTRI